MFPSSRGAHRPTVRTLLVLAFLVLAAPAPRASAQSASGALVSLGPGASLSFTAPDPLFGVTGWITTGEGFEPFHLPRTDPFVTFSGEADISLGGALLRLTILDGVVCGVLDTACLGALAAGPPGVTLAGFDLVPGPSALTTVRPDLAGTWRFHGLAASTTAGQAGRWVRGALTPDRGTWRTTGTGVDSAGQKVVVSGGIAGIGPLSGALSEYWLISGRVGSEGTNWFLETTLDPSVDVVTSAGAVLDGGFRVRPTWMSLVRETGAVFAQTDLAGDWRVYGMTTPEVPGARGAWLEGRLAIGSRGGVTGRLLLPDRTVLLPTGSLTLAANGVVSGRLGAWADGATMDATMIHGGSAAVGVVTSRWANGPTARDFGLVALVRPPGSTFDSSYLAGTWRLQALSVLAGHGSLGTSLAGSVTLDAGGRVVSGEVVDVTGASAALSGGGLTLAVDGLVSGTLTGPLGAGTLRLSGSVATANVIVGRTTIEAADSAGRAVVAHGFMTLARDDALPPHSPSLLVVTSGTGRGLVRSDASGIECGADCHEAYAFGSEVTLSATPALGSAFAGWSGACSGVDACTVAMTGVRFVTATFRRVPPATLSVKRSGAGRVTSDPAGVDCGRDCFEAYVHGTAVTLRPVAEPGAVFAGWSGACTGQGPCTLTMDMSRSVTASFARSEPAALTVRLDGDGAGTATSAPAGIECGSDCVETYPGGTLVTLSATAAAGSRFTGWRGACAGTRPCTVTINGRRLVRAIFLRIRGVTLTVSLTGTGQGGVTSQPAGIACGSDCSRSFPRGTVVTLSGVPSTGSVFAGWRGACSGIGSCAVPLHDATHVTAEFSRATIIPGGLVTTSSGLLLTSPAGAR